MGRIDDRLAELGLDLPELFAAPAGVEFKFELVRIIDGVAFISGQAAVTPLTPIIHASFGSAAATVETPDLPASKSSLMAWEARSSSDGESRPSCARSTSCASISSGETEVASAPGFSTTAASSGKSSGAASSAEISAGVSGAGSVGSMC